MTDFKSSKSGLAARLNRRNLIRRAAAAGALLPALGLPLNALADGTPVSSPAASPVGSPIAVPLLAPSATPNADAKNGQSSSLVVAANPDSWDLTKSTWVTWQAVCFMYDRLLTFDDKENLQPGLALSVDISPNGLEYTLKLRDGVLFHDGTPFNADAVKFNIQRHIDVPDSAFNSVYAPVDHVEVVDPLTAKIVLKVVQPNFKYEGLSEWGALQVSPTAFAKLGATGFASAPVGTGPFKFSSYVPGSKIKFVRNDSYWGGAPYLDSVEVLVVPEPSVQLTELEANAADTTQISPKDFEAVKGEGYTIAEEVSPGVSFVSLNASRGATTELAVRKAIARAIDRDSMITAILYGHGQKSTAGVTQDSPFYSPDISGIEFDPTAAGKLLDDAGWAAGSAGMRSRNGTPLSVNILSTNFTDWALYDQAIQEQLKAVGIASTIKSLEWNAYLDEWRTNAGDWDVTYHQQGSLLASVSPIQASWYPKAYWSITQIIHATDPAMVAISDQLQKLQDEFTVTLDDARRKAIAKEAQQIFMDNQLSVWLWHSATLTAFNTRLQDYRLTHSGRIVELDKAWIKS